VDLKIGDHTVHLGVSNNQFAVTDDLAQALRSASSGQVQISFATAQGKTVTHPIGDRTIAAWKTIYKTTPTQ
jgi:DNA-binding transcriptional regulator LsrR (DeoR family)